MITINNKPKITFKPLLLIALLILSSCGGGDGVRVIKLGHGLDTKHPVHDAMVYMAERLEEKSNGKMIMKVYPNAQLGNERELVELLQIGSLGMTKVSSAVMESFAPKIQVLSQPYLFRDDEHRDRILKGDIGKMLLNEGTQFWLKGLCYYDAGSRSFYTKDKPVETPEDLVGKKIRVMESNTAINMVNSFGGSPTPVSWGELYTALQQGIVDGAENNPPSVISSRHYEICKFYSLDEHTAVPDMLIVSTKVWDLLNDQEKQWVQEAADESATFQYKLWAEAEAESMRLLEEAGVTITKPDKELFRKAVEPMYEQIKQSEPEMYEIIDKIRKHD
ncbi:C4-dicarboxylate ABC transporter substrate-binding protein [Echinicola pacifica]|uniref:C4-dicarboxylate ABC transporter substrate-binding protein n=1 Tax=Echinicola pacifica TaxID=346377 RepID=A0A918PMR4_9BACT|nr:TRAP transporter substrate-binding protein [Echinicola pacifica]GGZ16457.1 C4-dicarboxylate ABC transporter substrate-binding protein [Echinicola pacifica]